jgi:hypothetical protein
MLSGRGVPAAVASCRDGRRRERAVLDRDGVDAEPRHCMRWLPVGQRWHAWRCAWRMLTRRRPRPGRSSRPPILSARRTASSLVCRARHRRRVPRLDTSRMVLAAECRWRSDGTAPAGLCSGPLAAPAQPAASCLTFRARRRDPAPPSGASSHDPAAQRRSWSDGTAPAGRFRAPRTPATPTALA